MTPVYTGTTPTTGLALKIQQGGHATVQTHQQVDQNTSNPGQTYGPHKSFVWNGNVYMPMGNQPGGGANGWWKYNPILDKMVWSLYSPMQITMIPLFDRIGFAYVSDWGWGMGPEDRRAQTSTSSQTLNDYATFGTDVVGTYVAGNQMVRWSYPFTGVPSFGPARPDGTMSRVCELGGEFYLVWIDDIAGSLKLYKFEAGALNLVGTPSLHASLSQYDPTAAQEQALFKFNNKLFLIVASQFVSIQKYRLFELDVSDGSSVERNSYLPAAWTANSPAAQEQIMEVRDSISPNEQVFLIGYQFSAANWECYEFQEGSFVLVDTGTEALLPGGGAVVFDPTARGAQFKSAVDSTPSSFVRSEIECYDLNANGLVDIDPRYRWVGAESPPYLQCTGKAPNDTVTNLATAPTQSALSDLDDDFGDGTLDEELWERVTTALKLSTINRDYGHGYLGGLVMGTVATEVSGAVRFGRASETVEAYQGVGVRSKSRIDGAFQADFVIADPENLTAPSTSPARFMFVYVRTAVNEGYGVMIWNHNTGPQVYVRGLWLRADNDWVVSADFTAADGDVLRFVRNGSNVWTITHDPAGAANDLTPAGGTNYSDEVEIVMGAAGNSTSTWVEGGTAVGSEPGFSDVAISGAGSPGTYQGGVKHIFDWDHATDLGAGVTGSAELYVDTQRS
jgi:hypothetical protein